MLSQVLYVYSANLPCLTNRYAGIIDVWFQLNAPKARPRPVLRLLLRAKLLSLVEYSVIIIGQIKTDGLLVPVPFSGLLFICAYRIRLRIESYQN